MTLGKSIRNNMKELLLPEKTGVNRRIPKQKFYENIDISPALKRVFVEQIKTIYWRNKIAPSTVNIAQGETVTEIEVFEVKLATETPPELVLRQIDKAIPYHIVFLVEYGGRYQAWTAYKEASAGTNAFKVHSYYHTDWMPEENLPLKLEGLNTDKVYENFVRQIGGEELAPDGEESLRDSVERDERRWELQKQIDKLEKMARAENQPRKKFELVQKINEIKEQINE